MNPKILIFIDWYKPGFRAGGPIRSVSNLVSQLYSSYDFYIVTRDTDYLETKPYSNIKQNTWNKFDDSQVFYLSTENQNKHFIKKLIKEINPQIVYCNSLYSPKFTLSPIRIANRLNIKTIVAVRGMLSKGSLAVKSHKKKVFLSIIKTIGLFKNTIFHATNDEEKNDILNIFGNNTSIITAPNLPEQKTTSFQPKIKKPGHLKLVFIGRVAQEKNTLYAINVLKYCKQNIELDIYGSIYNHEYFNQCTNAINQLPSNIVVEYKGVLKHDLIDEVLKNYHVIYSPSTGENFGHSILEGMTNSCIPVISDKTPWRNLEAKNIGFDISLKQPEHFSNTIDRLANMEEKEITDLSKKTYEFAQSIINNDKVVEDYHQLFQLNN